MTDDEEPESDEPGTDAVEFEAMRAVAERASRLAKTGLKSRSGPALFSDDALP
jgi:hypothetical protein